MEAVELKATTREGTGKGVARKLRQAGVIPGVLYGQNENIPVAVDASEFDRLLRRISSGNVVLDVKLEGREDSELKALIREVQRDPVDERVLHLDLEHITMSQRVRVQVPVRLTGNAEGVKAGGILEHLQRTIDVECPASDIPEEVVVDITALERGDSIHVRDLDLPNVTVHNTDDQVVVSVVAKAKEEEVEKPEEEEEGVPVAEGEAPAEGAAPEETPEESKSD